MGFILVLIAVLFVFSVFLYLSIHELICVYRNPFPLFCNEDKRFGEIFVDKEKEYKTRSILKDMEI